MGNFNELIINGDMIVTENIHIGKIKQNGTALLDLIYPIGTIYININNVSPAKIFGGSWTAINDVFLWAKGNTTPPAGEAKHVLTSQEVPSHYHNKGNLSINGSGNTNSESGHSHSITIGEHSHQYSTMKYLNRENWGGSGGDYNGLEGATSTGITISASSSSNNGHTHSIDASKNTGTITGNVAYAGNTDGHNNMPPYIKVYMWKRTK